MIIDSVNLSTLGIKVLTRGTSLAAPRVRHAMAGTPGAQRRIRIGQEAPEPRLLTLAGLIEASSVSALQDAHDELKHMTRPGKDLTVAWSDRTGIEYIGRRESLDPQEFHPAWLQTRLRFELAIICEDPRGRETSLQNKNTSGAAPLTLTPDVGTAIMPVIITITGNSSANLVDPVVQYRDGSDSVITSFSYSGTLTGSDTLVVDSEAFTVELNGSDDGGNLSGTIFDIDPGDGDYLGSPTGPDIRLTADSGSADLFKVEYRRRYQ